MWTSGLTFLILICSLKKRILMLSLPRSWVTWSRSKISPCSRTITWDEATTSKMQRPCPWWRRWIPCLGYIKCQSILANWWWKMQQHCDSMSEEFNKSWCPLARRWLILPNVPHQMSSNMLILSQQGRSPRPIKEFCLHINTGVPVNFLK